MNNNNSICTYRSDTLTWTAVKIDPSIQARAGHTSLCLPYRHENNERDEVVLFGGGNNDGKFFQDMMSISVPFASTAVPATELKLSNNR